MSRPYKPHFEENFEENNRYLERQAAYETRLLKAIEACAADYPDIPLEEMLVGAVIHFSSKGKIDPQGVIDPLLEWAAPETE